MSVGSITIKESPVIGSVDFNDNLEAGDWVRDSYEHEIRSIGGFWRAQFELQPDRLGLGYLEEYMENGVGRNVDAYDSNGLLVWQGYIDRLKLELPGVDIVVTLDNMANRVWVRFLSTAGGATNRSTKANDTESQNRFGTKEQTLAGNIISVSAAADQAAEANLSQYADPRQSETGIRSTIGEREPRLKIFCKGYYHTLNWRTYNQTATTGDQNINVQIQDIINDMGEFIDDTDLVTNTTQVTQYHDDDEFAGDIIQRITNLADSSNNRHIIGVYEDRELRYEQMIDIDSSASDIINIKYGFQTKNNVQLIKELATGRIIPPSQIRPNNWLKVEDLSGSKIPLSITPSKDTQNTFVESVIYREPFTVMIHGYQASQAESVLASINQLGGSNTL